jgi:hypothetical protein
MKKLSILLFSLILLSGVKADEGMWMLPLIEKLNIQKMNGMSCTLTAKEIYNENGTSLKDAVIIFGGGCTGVMVSPQGLLFTNHHCGYGAIQQLSSVEHNYLKNGFTAEKPEDEIYAPGLTVKFLVKIEEVTERVISELADLNGDARSEKRDSILKIIKEEAEKDTHYKAQVRSFYAGNEFYTFVFEEFTDVRLAFTPPSSIGKFGGDTDNWMWPRHTGDFSVFRVYADSTGKPANYSKNNIPYSPKRFAAISNKGYQEGDFAMIMGNPGTTTRYLTSWGVENRMNTSNRARIEVRGAKQDVWKEFMIADEAINIAYAGKYARSSNYWKNSIGMNNAIQKLKVIDTKKAQEVEFTSWIEKNPERKARYGKVLNELEEAYTAIYPYSKAINFLRESLLGGAEMPRIANQIERASNGNITKDNLLKRAAEAFEDYYQKVDEATLPVMLAEYRKAVDADALPEIYRTIDRKYKGDYKKYTQRLFSKSVFSSLEKFEKAVKSGKTNFSSDPAVLFMKDVLKTNDAFLKGEYKKLYTKITDAERVYQKGLMEMAAETGKVLYPDANSTMRLTYGKIGGYQPADAVTYSHFTTTEGILEKEKPGDYEFDVPASLKNAIVEQKFGAYADLKTGKMHVGFLSNNDITGGNSGSPIFNAKGELIGLAFDGNWEAMSGDIVFEPDLQRTINVDIRYVLFIMDKVGNAKRLIDELSIK